MFNHIIAVIKRICGIVDFEALEKQALNDVQIENIKDYIYGISDIIR